MHKKITNIVQSTEHVLSKAFYLLQLASLIASFYLTDDHILSV